MKSFTRKAIALALLSGAALSANADNTYSLGPLSLTWGPRDPGSYFLTVASVTNGSLGGAYSTSFLVTAVPETESYALFLAGLGIIGAIAHRRSKINVA